MGKYGKNGSYGGYDRNNKEREALDYYATPPCEVTNILNVLNIDKEKNYTILEPCCGGGHMVEGIVKYFNNADICATDIKERENMFLDSHYKAGIKYMAGKEYDFLSDDYPIKKSDIVIMNPPFKVITPFILHGLEIADNMLIVFGRTKIIEGINRFNEIFSKYPPTDMYQYIDRVACGKNGIFEGVNAVEAHAWFVWNKQEMENSYNTKLHWLFRKK